MRKKFGGTFNCLSYHGAGVLASMVERFWFDCGHPNVKAERFQIEGFEVWGVRSNLVGGLPPSQPPIV